MVEASSISRWLMEAIPWIFSGIGVFAIGFIRSHFRRTPAVGKDSIQILSPRFGALVRRDTLVSGVVARPASTVLVVIHPMSTDQYWPQRKVNVRNDGTWAVEVLIGSVASDERGARFEIVAVADPLSSVSEVLRDWPDAKARSDIIQVIRK
jgi:hypothetical protein